MSDVIVSVRGLGKRYRLGASTGPRARYSTLRDAIVQSFRKPFRRRELREDFWALRDVSFDVKRGEVVGIIGRNGAGKSTLLKILSRITDPTEGEADLYGRVGSLLEVGTGFHPELTGRENVYLNGSILGMRRREIAAQFDAIVGFAEVEKFIDTPVKFYSSGMYMRLAFAVAAHLEPEILIVDEVLAVGDAEFQKKCLGKMGEVAKGGRTVFFVSHNMQAIQRLCSRAVVLRGGCVVADSNPMDAIPHYTGTGTSFCTERVWDVNTNGTNDGRARLKRASVVNRDGEPQGVFSVHDPVVIEVEYSTNLQEVNPTAILQIFNDVGDCLLCSNEFTSESWRNRLPSSRTVRCRCFIRGGLMAEGLFHVLVGLGSYNPDVLYAVERDALSFQITDPCDGRGVRGPFKGEWPGLMRPALEWTTEDAA